MGSFIVVVLAFAVALGAGAGALFGLAQGWVLRGHAPRWRLWIAANAVGWAVGLPFTYLAGGLDLQSPVLVGLAGGAVDEIEVDVVETRGAGLPCRIDCTTRRVRPVQDRQHVRRGRLHAQ